MTFLVKEFQRRYTVVGGSPLNRITGEQAAALEAVLNGGASGSRYRALVGMRHAPPFIQEAFEKLAAEGIKQVVCIIMSPQYSPTTMGGYLRAVEKAKDALGTGADVRVAGSWHLEPAFIDALARRTTQALDRLSPADRATIPVIFTAHSLPKSVVDREPFYIDQLKDTAAAVAKKLSLDSARWQFAYQSAGHTPEEWLKPDIKELFPDMHKAGHKAALVAPIQFLADHLEVLYDIDVAAGEEAAEAGIKMLRIETFNTMPEFIQVLANVVKRELAR